WLQSGGVALLVVVAVAQFVEHAAGLRFGAPALRETSPVLRGVFRGLTVAMAVACCAALLLGYWALSTSMARQGELAGMDSDSTWTAQAKATDSKGDFGFADSAERALLAEQLRERLPQIERVGFGTLRPFAEGEGPLNSYTLPNAPDTTLRFRMNQIEGDALGAMGLKLVAGRALPESGYALEVLLDQRAAVDLARRIGKPSVLGELLRDASSMDYEIVGLVEAMPYNMELASPLGTVYQRMGSMVPRFHVLMRGGVSAAEVERAMAEPFNVSALRFKLEESQHLPALAERAQARYRARLLFATSTAAVTLFIALLALVSMVVVEARARSHSLAVRACLGARPLNLAMHAFRGLLLALGFGAVLGGLLALAATRSIPALAAIGTGSAVDIALPVLALLLLGVLICALVLALQQRGAALYRRLQAE
ncbi:MAG: ABC transporter permease, partial [Lysobacterales bacterium]